MTAGRSAVDAVARKDALRIVVLHLAHLGHQIGRGDQLLRGIAPRQHRFGLRRPGGEQ